MLRCTFARNPDVGAWGATSPPRRDLLAPLARYPARRTHQFPTSLARTTIDPIRDPCDDFPLERFTPN